jgi:hypothetical protein
MRALLELIGATAIAAVAMIAVFLFWSPGYLDIDIPVARHRGGGTFFWESHRTQLAYADSRGVLYVYRQVGNTSDVHEDSWKTEADVYAYFEQHLERLGWKFSVAGIQYPPAPESALLGVEGTKLYYQPGNPNATLYLSVWPKRTSGFNVALTTANKSLGRLVFEVLDD